MISHPRFHSWQAGTVSLAVLSLFLLLTPSSPARAQTATDTAGYPYWIEMMQDPDANFFAVQRAFETYWKDRPVTRSSGFKPFKRWEYMQQLRAGRDGQRPDPERARNAWLKLMQNGEAKSKNAGDWQELGPKFLPIDAPGLGRVNAMAFHPGDPDIYWAGAPSGGLWKSTDRGLSWSSNTDDLPTLGVSAILVDYANPDILYIGTGDRDASDAIGLGVYKSTDGGLTWNPSSNGMGNVTVGKMLMHPADPMLVYAATSGGIFKSENGGNDWTDISPNQGNFKDLVFKPGDPNTLYAVRNSLVFRSTDAGNSWTQLTNGLPMAYRSCLGVTPANPEVLYVLMSYSDGFKGVYLSVDGGQTFTTQSTSPNILSWGCEGGSGGQAWYDLCLAVDPLDPSVVYVGGVNVWKSADSGQHWDIVAHWYGGCDVAFTHADQHVFEWNPHNGHLHTGNDGGCFYTPDGGTEWIMISQGLAISQIYKIGQSATVRDQIMNGYQDNGSAVYLDTTWRNVMGADGMECAVDPADPGYMYGTIYYGKVTRIINLTDKATIAGQGVNEITEAGNWVTPFIIHRNDPNTMFIGMNNVWRSNNIKTPDGDTVTFKKITAGLTSGNCKELEQSPADDDLLYLIKYNGRVYRTDQANADMPVWIDLTANLPPDLLNPSDLAASYAEENTAYLSSDGQVYKTTDRGATWSEITGGLPDVYYSSILCTKSQQERLYVGSDIGVFYKDDSMDDWITFSEGLPANGRVTEVEAFYDPAAPVNNRIRAATYGRGLWSSTLHQSQPLAQFSADQEQTVPGCPVHFTDQSLGNPTHYLWTFDGGTPASSTAQVPPPVYYATPGTYSVSLTVTNDAGGDTLEIQQYITVSGSLLPQPSFSASDSVFCSGSAVVFFTDHSQYCPTSWHWSFNPATITFLNGSNASSMNPVVRFDQDGTYAVSLQVGNVNGDTSLSVPHLIRVGGSLLPFTEDFESGSFESRNWTVENPDHDLSWEIWNTGGTEPGSHSARIRIFNTNSMGRRDRLISQPLDLSGQEHATLTLDHAYATYQAEYSDTLIILASEDCGLTWTQLYKGFDDGTGNFATHPPLASGFVPADTTDWCGSSFGSPCLSLDMSAYAGKKNVKVAFESVSFISNNLYLDNINLQASTGIPVPGREWQVLVFPNPTDGHLNILLNEKKDIQSIRFLTPLGQEILNLTPGYDRMLTVDLGDIPGGIYYIEVTGEGGRTVSKVLVK